MTRDKSFKRLVRARMDKTGESYTAARAVLLAADEPTGTDAPVLATSDPEIRRREPTGTDAPVLATSDPEIRRRTGRGWEDWFDLLDEWNAAELAHKEIARRVADELGIEPLVWEAQAVTLSYERARGLRAVGQRADGFAITASKTVAVPVDVLFEAFVDGSQREGWLPDGQLSKRTATRPSSVRFDWAGGETRVNVVLAVKGPVKTTVTIEHARLVDAGEADRMKAYWRERLTSLKAHLETGQTDA